MHASVNSANVGLRVARDQKEAEKWKQLCESRGLGD